MFAHNDAPQPEQPMHEPPAQSTPPTRKKQRIGTTALLVLALTGGAIGGGVVGTVAAENWNAPQQPTTSVVAGEPISTQNQATVNVAGAVFNKISASVVRIDVAGAAPSGFSLEGSGSGIVVDASGLILTNNHVVEGARTVSVKFSSGAEREAQVLGTDQGNDLALLKVDLPANVPVAPLGDSDQTQVGETAIAIGSPFGLDQSVTQGIISAVHRNWNPDNGRTRRNLLQTDAPINPGNSGGPLLNDRGEVIGINTMIESPIRGSVGVGFAVPINTAKTLLPQLEAGAQLKPVWLGIAGQALDQTIAQDQNLSVQTGILIVDVVPNSPAAQAGLRGGQQSNERIPRGGDVITAVDGKAVNNLDELSAQLSGHKPGDSVTVTIVRNGQEQQINVTLQAWPTDAE